MAIADDIDLVQWVRVYWYEVFHPEFAPQILYPTDPLPPQTPFNRAEEPIWVGKSCHFCEPSRLIDVAQGMWSSDSFVTDAWAEKGMRAISLTGWPNEYADLGSIAANSAERRMRILLAYVRDSLFSPCISFAGAIFNLPDVATKTHGNLGIRARLISTGKFFIFLLGRDKAKIAAEDKSRRRPIGVVVVASRVPLFPFSASSMSLLDVSRPECVVKQPRGAPLRKKNIP